MKSAHELMTAAEYARVLRPLLPVHAFRPESRHLIPISVHLAAFIGSCLLLRAAESWWMCLACALLMGHEIACLGFLAHDVSHRSVVRSRWMTAALEMLLFGVNSIPPVLWRKVHNQNHHAETNTLKDPDRRFMREEQTWATRFYAWLLFPSSEGMAHNPVVLFQFIPYIFRHVVAAFLPGGMKISVVPNKPVFTWRQKWRMVAELGIIALIEHGIWRLTGGEWWKFFWAYPVALGVASAVVMTYVFTNHFLNPLCEHTDPVVGTTSVTVPRWVDWMHDNFSYHTEHHVFPGMNPRHYPEVSRLLQAHFPERYNRVALREAWRQLWKKGGYLG